MSSTISFDAPEEISGGGNFLTEPGSYHLLIKDIRAGQNGSDDMVDGIWTELEVLAGEHAGKKITMTLYNGNISHKDSGEFARKKQAAFLIAANILTPAQLGQKVSIDVSQGNGHQVCCVLELGQPSAKTGKRYLEIHYTDVFHVDDPRAEKIAKDADGLALIDAQFRRAADFFAPLVAKKTPANGSAKSTSAKQDDFSDL